MSHHNTKSSKLHNNFLQLFLFKQTYTKVFVDNPHFFHYTVGVGGVHPFFGGSGNLL